MLSEDAVADTEALLSAAAELARVAEEARLDQHAVASREALHPRAQSVQDSRSVRSRYLRQGNTGNPVTHEDVQVVQRGRADRDPHLLGARLRQRPIAVLEDLVAAVLLEENGFHGNKSAVGSRQSTVGKRHELIIGPTLICRLLTVDC